MMTTNQVAEIKDQTLTKIPTHIAFILDGNRRWAQEKKFSPNKGHKKGAENITNLCDWCIKYGVKFLTLYCLSVENLSRSKNELRYLYKSIDKFLVPTRIREYNDRGINIAVIGDFSILPKNVAKTLESANASQIKNAKLFLQLCIGYSGKNEIVNAVKKLIQSDIKTENIDTSTFEKFLFTSSIPEVDLLIRTGGDKRISNFLLWKISYAELYFCKTYFPSFNENDFLLALYEFQNRMRRYGK